MQNSAGVWVAQTPVQVPLAKYRLSPSPSIAEIARVFNQSQDELQKVTAPLRDITLVNSVVYSGYSFTQGTTVQVAHHLGSANVTVHYSAPRAVPGVTAGQFGLYWQINTNPALVDVTPFGTFVCDLEFRISPTAEHGTPGPVPTSGGGSTPTGTGAVVVTGGTESAVNGSAATVLTSNGSSSLPTFQPLPSAVVPTNVGPYASRPAATGSGRTYQCTDIPVEYIDVAPGVWSQRYSAYVPNSSVTASSYIYVSPQLRAMQSGDAITVSNVDLTGGTCTCALTVPGGSMSASACWAVTLTAVWSTTCMSYPQINLIVAASAASGASAYSVGFYAASGPVGVHYIHFPVDGASTFSVSAGSAMFAFSANIVRLRILNDGGNLLHTLLSPDGIIWTPVYSDSPQTVTAYGFFLGVDAGSNGMTQFGRMTILENNYHDASTIQQYSVSAVTTTSTTTTVTLGAHSILPGDLVSVRGMTGLTNLNITSPGGAGTCVWPVAAVTSTTITIISAPSGAYTGGGIVTLVSR